MDRQGFSFSTQYFGSFLGTLATRLACCLAWGFKSNQCRIFLLCAWLGMPWPWTVVFSTACVAIYGTGYGLANPSVNLRATRLPSSNVAAAVSLLNFFLGSRRGLQPLSGRFFLGNLSLRWLSGALAVLFLALAVAHFVQKRNLLIPPRPVRNVRLRFGEPPCGLRLDFARAALFSLCGIEISVGGWVALDEKQMVGFNPARMAAAPAFFYGFLRSVVSCSRRIKYFSQRLLSVGGLVMAAAGVAWSRLRSLPWLCTPARCSRPRLRAAIPITSPGWRLVSRMTPTGWPPSFSAQRGLGLVDSLAGGRVGVADALTALWI